MTADKTPPNTPPKQVNLKSSAATSKTIKSGNQRFRIVHEYVDCPSEGCEKELAGHRLKEDLHNGSELWDDFVDAKLSIIPKLLETIQAKKTFIVFNSFKTLLYAKAKLLHAITLDDLQKDRTIDWECLLIADKNIESLNDLKLHLEISSACLLHFSTPFKFTDQHAVSFHLKRSHLLAPDYARYCQRIKQFEVNNKYRLTNIHISPSSAPYAFDQILRVVSGFEYSHRFPRDNHKMWEEFAKMFDGKDESIPKFQLGRIGLKDEEDLRLISKFKNIMKLASEIEVTDKKQKRRDKAMFKDENENPFL